jgi:hypothetical protein
MPPASIHRFFFVPLILLAGCATDEADTDITAQACESQIGQWIEFTAPPRPTALEKGYPDLGGGRALVSRAGDVGLVVDESLRNPVTTFSGCHWWLMRCNDEHGNLDDCYLSAPRCEGETPWLADGLCCPQACYDDYAQRRRDGIAPSEALLATAEARTCFPGLAAYAAGGAP